LLQWAPSESGAGLAILPEGSAAGYRRLLNGEVIAAAIHFHALDGAERDVNVDVVRDEAALYDAVLIAFATREQGLLVAPGNPLSPAGAAEVGDRQLRLAVRPEGAGAQQLLLWSVAAAPPVARRRGCDGAGAHRPRCGAGDPRRSRRLRHCHPCRRHRGRR